MTILTTPGLDGYSLLDSGNGRRLEKFGKFLLSRPDPQCIWLPTLPQKEWDSADAVYVKTDEKGAKGKWLQKNPLPEKWLMKYQEITFFARLTAFKHTGIFPEQVIQWDFIRERIKNAQPQDKKIKILNLFGYTGIASLVCASMGAEVTHVDASRPAINWARENQEASNLTNKPIRWILDDVVKFVEREVRRGNIYDGLIMDPPIYGHGPDGEVWNFPVSFPKLLHDTRKILSSHPLFIIINAYAMSMSSLMLENVLQDAVGDIPGEIEVGEIALQEKSGKRLLSTGIFARFTSGK